MEAVNDAVKRSQVARPKMESDDTSCSKGQDTLPVSNCRHRSLTLHSRRRIGEVSKENKAKMQNNHADENNNGNSETSEMREMVVDLFWIVSVAKADAAIASLDRRGVLESIRSLIDRRTGRNITYDELRHTLLAYGNGTIQELRSNVVGRFLLVLNECRSRVIFYDLIEEILNGGCGSHPSTIVVDTTGPNISALTDEESFRGVMRRQNPVFDLSAMAGGDSEENCVARNLKGLEQRMMGLHISDDSHRATLTEMFREGSYVAMTQMPIEQIFQDLSPISVLQMLATPDDGN